MARSGKITADNDHKISSGDKRTVTATDCPDVGGEDKRALDTKVLNSNTDPVPISLTFPGPIKVSGTSVTDTSAAFPATNQADRASLSVRNISKNKSIYIVNSTGITLAGAGADNWEIGPNETINFDFDDTNQVNLVADSGDTVSIQILEIKGA